jgi:nucleotide-binding universal stress UspA family protein
MSDTTVGRAQFIQNILVATDFTPASETALQYALAIATGCNATIHLVHVIKSSPYETMTDQVSPSKFEQLESAATDDLENEQRDLRFVRHQVYMGYGAPHEVVDQLIREHHIDLVVVGTHGFEGFKRVVAGSGAEQIFRSTLCPVLTVRANVSAAGLKNGLSRILFPTDLLSDASRALAYARSIANRHKARLTLLYVMSGVTPLLPEETAWFEKPFLKRLGDLVIQSGVVQPDQVDCRIAYGDNAADAILATAREMCADLIVLSVRPEQPWTTRLPHKAYHIVAEASCPVLTVREEAL